MKRDDLLKTEHYIALRHFNAGFKYYPDLFPDYLTKAIALLLDVELVGVWFFKDDYTEIFCKSLYCKSKDGYEKDLVVDTSQYPVFFRVPEEKETVVIDDASIYPGMGSGHYLHNSVPGAAIIAPVWIDNVIVGLISLEHADKKRFWTSKEKKMGKMIAKQLKWVCEQGRVLTTAPEDANIREGCIMDITALKKTEEDLKNAVHRLRTIFNNVNDAIFIHDLDGRIIDVNDKMLEMYGSGRAKALAGKVQDEFSSSKNPDGLLPRYWQEVLDDKRRFFKWKARRGDGTDFDVEVQLTKLNLGDQDAILATVRDITAYKNTEEALRQSEERYKEIISSIEELYLELDLAGNINFCNEAACRMLKYSQEELLGINYRKLQLDPDKAYQAFNIVYRTGKPDKGYTLELLCKDGSLIFIELSISLIKDKDGKFIGFRAVGRDATERKQIEKKLTYISMHDQLTGLYNRAYMEQGMRRLEEKEDCQVSIILVDLDGLKLINDTMGHKQGDELLKKCAGILKQSIRGSDILARFGGDEFAIILPYTTEQAAEMVRQRIRTAIDQFNEHNPDIHLGVSMGVATSSMEGGSLEDTFNEADDFMYQEKLYRSAEAHEKIAVTVLHKLNNLDYITTGHAERLKELSIELGSKLDFSSRQLKDLAILAQAHDLGKISIPKDVLFKEQPLTEADWKIIRGHAEKGYRIARSIPTLATVADLILRHHERWDGRGYPIGLKGNNTPIECRIFSIVDAYDVMTHDRPYRRALSAEQAVAELRRCAGTQFDPVLVEEFIKMIEK